MQMILWSVCTVRQKRKEKENEREMITLKSRYLFGPNFEMKHTPQGKDSTGSGPGKAVIM